MENPSVFTTGEHGGAAHPVENVSWHDAVRFSEFLSEWPAELAAGRVYRLPTEAEWEHACRAGTATPFSFGSSASSRQANFDGNYPYHAGRGPYLRRTARVGSYEPNGFGLFDMHGNVAEWCSDSYEANYYAESPAEDPPGAQIPTNRILRGGCWDYGGRQSRSARRSWHAPDGHNGHIGFRVAVDVVR
jgi:formylglycine-generating enzyme required for sulfatase activity